MRCLPIRALLPALLLVLSLILPGLPHAVAAAEDPAEDLWVALAQGRAAVVMRHALAPGTGDPAAFDPADCATQRNLDAAGRAQARAIGDAFRAAGIDQARVHSSVWCRCRETAELLDLGPVEVLPALNSFFRDRGRADEQTAALREFLAAREGDGPVVLVTHQVNITALTGVYPSSGELIFVTRDSAAGTVGRALPAAP
ncbi:histidine phosphatase family protein [Marinibaculum pumilum]|uniref:Histidine phosphatase family protein n=1 Tax=Marinibaculum pumilum TaxID=1766165 RepID=A0ABV7KVH1_9PROT